LRSLRAFWNWCVQEEFIAWSPFTKLRIPRAPQKVIATFTQGQLRDLLAAIDISKPVGFRDWAVVLTLLDTGLRAGELAGLTLESVRLEEGIVKVHGKGNKERIVPIGARVQKAIWKYIQRHRPEPANPLCTNIFLTREGYPLTVNRLETIIENCGRRAGIQGVRCSPHTFRHTFSIWYMRNGGDVFSLQRILGHSSLDIVRLYVNMADTDVKSCHSKFSPGDNLDLGRGGRRLLAQKALAVNPEERREKTVKGDSQALRGHRDSIFSASSRHQGRNRS
jgi:integrase/recombinase XerD